MSQFLKRFAARSSPVLVLLLLSLAVNVFVLGVAATSWRRSDASNGERDRALARLAAKLPAEDAALVRQGARARRAQMQSARQEFDVAVREATASAARDPFDPQAFALSLAALRQKRIAITDLRIEFYTQVAPQLSARGRRQLAGAE